MGDFVNEVENDSNCIKQFQLEHLGLVAALMKQDNLIEKINTMIPKVGPHVKLSSGQSVAIMIMRILSGELPSGLCNVSNWAKNIPINLLSLDTNIENGYQSISRFTLADTLERINDYNPNEFIAKYIASSIDTEKVESIHLDSTSFHFHGVPKAPELVEISKNSYETCKEFSNEPVSVAHGYSRDNRPNDPQVNLCGVSCRLPGEERPIMIHSTAFSGNENDISKFQKFCEQDLERLQELYPNIKHLVMDSAGANAKALKAVNNIGIVALTRLADSKVRADIDMLSQNQDSLDTISIPSQQPNKANEVVEIKYKFLGIQDLTSKEGESIPVLKCGFSAESLRPIKVNSITAKAQKELEKIQDLLKKLSTQPKACETDALNEFNKITKTLKYCSISSPKIEPVQGYKGRGRPSKNAVKEVVAVKLTAEASIDQNLVNAAIEKELFYVIATTDIDTVQNAEGALKLYKTYHEQSDIEGCWRDIKATGTFFDSFYLEKVSRMKGLLVIVSLALFYQRKLMNIILKVMKDNKISISSHEQKQSLRTSWKSFVSYMRREGSMIIIGKGTVQITNLANNNSFIARLAEYIGPEAINFYRKETYTKMITTILESSQAMDNHLKEITHAARV